MQSNKRESPGTRPGLGEEQPLAYVHPLGECVSVADTRRFDTVDAKVSYLPQIARSLVFAHRQQITNCKFVTTE